ncbi:MAG: hypothetical protein PHH71_01045 [Clostridia bacterium]|jgi:predicted DNA-binding protein YlxM (UPF0122 family)|nr:hypothetical protein [Clostridia bacterium]MDD3232314.1 hypothetical protein [Clostridia bacterium]MDD3862989.1 hypothetical protein [Clostridia bacterium]MDD4408635.1 hypothetical protein [Clostridia bacterium]
MQIEELVETTKLYEIYKNSFNLNQREIFELYLYKNLQLNEIAQLKNSTRQAIYSRIKQSKQKLKELEENFGFYNKLNKISEFVRQLSLVHYEILKNLSNIQNFDFHTDKTIKNENQIAINKKTEYQNITYLQNFSKNSIDLINKLNKEILN